MKKLKPPKRTPKLKKAHLFGSLVIPKDVRIMDDGVWTGYENAPNHYDVQAKRKEP